MNDHAFSHDNLNAIRCLGIKTTFLCNNRCGFCWQPHHSTISDISPTALKNLQPLIEAGNLKVIQPAGGEVFLWRGIKGYIDYIQQYNKNVQMYLVTNGTLFDEYWYAKAESRFFSVISLSINAPNEKLYQRICNRNNFNRIRDALNILGDIRSRVPLPIQVSFVMTRPLMGKLSQFVDLVAGKVDSLLAREYRPPTFGIKEQEKFYRENHIPSQFKSKVCLEIENTSELAKSCGLIFDYSQFSLDLKADPIFSSLQTPSVVSTLK